MNELFIVIRLAAASHVYQKFEISARFVELEARGLVISVYHHLDFYARWIAC